MTYAVDQLHEEIAYVAFHFHWGMDTLLDMEHQDRRRWVSEIASLVQRAERGE